MGGRRWHLCVWCDWRAFGGAWATLALAHHVQAQHVKKAGAGAVPAPADDKMDTLRRPS